MFLFVLAQFLRAILLVCWVASCYFTSSSGTTEDGIYRTRLELFKALVPQHECCNVCSIGWIGQLCVYMEMIASNPESW